MAEDKEEIANMMTEEESTTEESETEKEITEDDLKSRGESYIQWCFECWHDDYLILSGEDLFQFVAFAVYGDPDQVVDEDWVGCGYSQKKAKHINKLMQIMLEKGGEKDEVRFSTAIVFGLEEKRRKKSQDYVSPVFRVLTPGKDAVFIDTKPRVYKNWTDWKKHNTLPKGILGYPSDGHYNIDDNGRVVMSWGVAPPSTKLARAVKGIDIASTAGGLALTGAAIASSALFPLATPVVVGLLVAEGVIGGYAIGRESHKLRDRKKHCETIDVRDPEARGHWLGIGVTALSLGAGVAASASLATRGAKIIKALGVLGKTLNASSRGLMAIQFLDNVNDLRKKLLSKNLQKIDIQSFVSKLFFWGHARVSLFTAQAIIETFNDELLEKMKENFRYSDDTLDGEQSAVLGSVLSSEASYEDDDGIRIKRIRDIESPHQFFTEYIGRELFYGTSDTK